MSDYFGVGGYFSESDIGGTNPQVHEVHAVLPIPHSSQPIYVSPFLANPYAQENQRLVNQALTEAEDVYNGWYATEPSIDPATGLPETQEQIQRRLDWQTFEFLHPFRARLIQWLSRR